MPPAQREALTNKLVYVARAGSRAVSEKAPEADLLAGELPAAALEAVQVLLAEVYVPLLAEQASWGRSTDAQTHEFLEARPPRAASHRCMFSAFLDMLGEAAGSEPGTLRAIAAQLKCMRQLGVSEPRCEQEVVAPLPRRRRARARR